MKARLENWINGLNSDWCVSRQRFFGVPFPVWYRVRQDGTVDYGARLLPHEDQLPIDPSTDVPEGYQAGQRDRPGGFSGDPDIMDTWATSSLTPQIAGRWEEDPDLFGRVFPMDVRPQAHDIIRTWLFSTVLRSELEHHSLPWFNAAISGWVLDPDRKKMSKSKGNVVTPMGLLEEHGSDGVRYWAASGRPGTDTAFDTGQMKVGRRLAIKLLNASKFVLSRPEPVGPVTHLLDRGLLTSLRGLIEDTTRALEGYDYARALQITETFFWSLCDNYLEMVKSRRYGDHGPEAAGSANASLLCALSVLNRLFAPYLPFAAEEVWSWWRPGSVHTASWPAVHEIDAVAAADADAQRALDAAIEVLGEIRRVKSIEKRPLKARIETAEVRWQCRRRSGCCRTWRSTSAPRPASIVSCTSGRRASVDVADVRARRRRRRRAAGMRSVPFAPLDPGLYREIVRRALAEDLGWGDVTTEATVGAGLKARGVILAKSPCVIAGLDVAAEAFRQLDPAAVFTVHKGDGSACAPGDIVAEVRGSAASMLTAERTALNLMQRMTGIATMTRRFVDAAGGRITILDTRKTTPTLRALEKYAVRAGGGTNHRGGLDDGILIKDNHIRLAGGLRGSGAADEGRQPGDADRGRSAEPRPGGRRRFSRAPTSSCSTTSRPIRSRTRLRGSPGAPRSRSPAA